MSENRENRPHVLLLTGTPGIGKTTVIRRAADRLRDKGLRGFYTEEIREKGERRGFRLVSFEGTTQTIAHVDFPKRHRVGKYGIDVETLDIAAALLRPDAKSCIEHLTRLHASIAREFPQIWGYPPSVKEAADRANKAWYDLAIAWHDPDRRVTWQSTLDGENS